MKKLVLMRHAKSDWGSGGLSDVERPLNERGRRSSGLIGKHLFELNLLPDLILVSAAQRTRETVQLMSAEWPKGERPLPRIEFADDLYLASAKTLMAQIRDAGENENTIMIIAHNPGIADLARKLSRDADAKVYARMCKKYPTGAFTLFKLNANAWSEAPTNAFSFEAFVRPKDIDEDKTRISASL